MGELMQKDPQGTGLKREGGAASGACVQSVAAVLITAAAIVISDEAAPLSAGRVAEHHLRIDPKIHQKSHRDGNHFRADPRQV